MHLEKPSLAKPLSDPSLQGYDVLQKIFFAPTETSQAAGAAFIKRVMQRNEDREPASGARWPKRKWTRFANGSKFPANAFPI